ncbi:MAG: right-handed parallel beta-helix repeat-containing protein [Synergistaceae bacterium]|jgi:predicted outer membrane repeat protein|nr:right-handed parallel beta-helix repeat-containing protein [Synergistaceae bacterium]
MKKVWMGSESISILIVALSVFLALTAAVSLPPAYSNEVIHVKDGAELDAAIQSATSGAMTVIYLDKDIDAVTSATYGVKDGPSGKWVTIDGQGYAIDGAASPDDKKYTALRFGNDNTSSEKRNTIVLRNLTMKNFFNGEAHGGGAIALYRGSLTIENCAFIGNKNGANTGPNNDKLTRGGGAVLVHGQGYLDITNSTFYGNESGVQGGAIFVKGAAKITNCTITGNTTKLNGGGVHCEPAGASDGYVSSALLINSIVAGNAALGDGERYDTAGVIADGGSNLLGSTPAIDPGRGTKAGVEVASILEPGAPKVNVKGTPTIALTKGSPAIDTADAALAPTVDQRDLTRGAKPDIGAYELQ